MGRGSLGNELLNSLGWLKGQQARKAIRGKDVVIGSRKPKRFSKKPKRFSKKPMGVKEIKRK